MNIELFYDYQKFDLEIVLIKSLKTQTKDTKKILKSYNFVPKEGSSLFLLDLKKLYIGVDKLKGEDLKIAFSNAVRELKKYKYKNIKVSLFDLIVKMGA